MKGLAFLLSFLTIALSLYAQSLKNATGTQASIAINDTQRVHELFGLADEYALAKPDSAFAYALEGLTLSRKIGYKPGEMSGLATTGTLLGLFGNHPEELNSKLQALKIAEESNDTTMMVYATINIGNAYFEMKDYKKAVEYFHSARRLATKSNAQDDVRWSTENLGAAHLLLRNLDSALIYTQQAQSLTVGSGEPMFNLQLNMGHIYLERNEHRLALEYFKSALPEIIKLNNEYSLSEAYGAVASAYEKQNQGDSSLYYARKAYDLATQNNFLRRRAEAASYLGDHYTRKKQWDSAYFYMAESKAINDSLLNEQKRNQVQSLTFQEQLRQNERREAAEKALIEREHNIQYAAITLGVIALLIVFLLLSHSIIVNQALIKFLGILSLLIVFEFVNLLIHPYVGEATHHSPILMLVAMVLIAALLIPIHHRLEHWITSKMVEKNKKIRLEAAKRTIAELEGQGAEAQVGH